MKKRILYILLAVLLLAAVWVISGFTGNPVSAFPQMDKELPAGVTFQAAFHGDGTVELVCGEEALTLSMGAFPAESTALGAAQIQVLSPGAVHVIFGATSILFLEESADAGDVTADLVWGYVTRSHGANFALLPEEPPEELRKNLEEQGLSILVPTEESTVNVQSDGKEILLHWTAHGAFPAMSAAK